MYICALFFLCQMNNEIKFFAGRNSMLLAKSIAKSYGSKLSESSVINFSDGEIEPSFKETIRGSHVFLVQSTPPPSENLMELFLMIEAAKRASALKIIAVVADVGYA